MTGGRCRSPADRALADVVARFRHPARAAGGAARRLRLGRRRPALRGRWTDLNAYAVRVAGTVGAMMAVLMGVRAPDVVARACDLGVAMQLSNIARDVGEDARAGRLYLPLPGCARPASTPMRGWRSPVYTDALGAVVQAPADGRRYALRPRRRGHRAAAAGLPAGHPRGARPLCRDRPRSGAPGIRFGVAARRRVVPAQGTPARAHGAADRSASNKTMVFPRLIRPAF